MTVLTKFPVVKLRSISHCQRHIVTEWFVRD